MSNYWDDEEDEAVQIMVNGLGAELVFDTEIRTVLVQSHSEGSTFIPASKSTFREPDHEQEKLLEKVMDLLVKGGLKVRY